MYLSWIGEEDVAAAALRVVALSRRQLDRVVGIEASYAELDRNNPYVRIFVTLYRYARGLSNDSVAAPLEVAQSVLTNPLYAGPAGFTEAPVLHLVLQAAQARAKQRRGEPLSEEERELLR